MTRRPAAKLEESVRRQDSRRRPSYALGRSTARILLSPVTRREWRAATGDSVGGNGRRRVSSSVALLVGHSPDGNAAAAAAAAAEIFHAHAHALGKCAAAAVGEGKILL